MSAAKLNPTAKRRDYETLRLARWAVLDALMATRNITGRAADCFDGTDTGAAFQALGEAIARLDDSPEMKAVTDLLFAAQNALDHA